MNRIDYPIKNTNMFAILDEDTAISLNGIPLYHSKNNYLKLRINNKWYMLGRFILKCKGSQDIDHINLNPLDNRRCNLRVLSISSNHVSRRTKTKGSSKYKGVVWNKRLQKWEVCVSKHRIHYYGGVHIDELEAAKASQKLYDIHYPELNLNILDL